MPKFKFTITGTYQADPKDYNTDDIEKMIQIDKETGPFEILEFSDDLKFEIEEVQ